MNEEFRGSPEQFHGDKYDPRKPATGCPQCGMLEGHSVHCYTISGAAYDKPETGEWTYGYVENLYRGHTHSVDGLRAIMVAHNAALAAREPASGEWTVDRIREHLADDPIYGFATLARDINAALAAERQRADEAEQGELNEATKLAAERKGHEMDGQLISSQEQQLAAEREKVQMLVDALKRIADGQAMLFPRDLRAIAANALVNEAK